MEKLREQIARNPSYSDLLKHLDYMERFRISDPSLALDAAKSLLESLAKTMLADRKIALNENDSIQTVIKKAVKTSQALASLSDNDSVQKIVNGMETASVGIGTLRNSFGLLSHGRDLQSKGIDKLSTNLVLDTTLSIAHFLFALHEEERTTKQRIVYEDNPDFNHFIDSQYESAEIVIEEVPITPSRALFYEDIEVYRAHLIDFKSAKRDLLDKLSPDCKTGVLEDIIDVYEFLNETDIEFIQQRFDTTDFKNVSKDVIEYFRSTFFYNRPKENTSPNEVTQ